MKHILFVLALAIIAGCSTQPSRPSTVPSDAFFVGGADGGVFLRCSRNSSNTKTYQCSIYNDFSGEVLSEGIFAVAASGNPDFDPNDKGMYDSWDGRGLHLKDGRVLIKRL
jgi:hypothetical protein